MNQVSLFQQQPIRIVLVTSDQDLAERLDAFLKSARTMRLAETFLYWDRQDCLERLDDIDPDVLLVQEGVSGEQAHEIAYSVKQSRSATAIFALVQRQQYADADYHRQLMATAAAGVLELTEEPKRDFSDWLPAIREAVELHKRFIGQERGSGGWIIAVHGLKGGIGRTLTTANLGTALARHTLRDGEPEKSVLILDLDWPFGDIDVFMNLAPAHSALDLISVMGNLTRTNIKSATTSCPGTSLQALVSCLAHEQLDFLRDMMEEELFSPQYEGVLDSLLDQVENTRTPIAPLDTRQRTLLEHVLRKAKSKQVVVQLARQLITRASRDYDFVLIDLPPRIDELTLCALQEANRILVLCTPDVPSIQALRTELNILTQLDIPGERIRLVLNRVRRESEIRASDVRDLFSSQVWWSELSEDPALEFLVNTSVLATRASRETPFAEDIRRLADQVLGERGLPVQAAGRRA